MMKVLVTGLLGAAIVLPTTAMAQDRSLREAFRQRMEARGQVPAPSRPERAAGVGERGGGERRREANAQAGGWSRPDRGDAPAAMRREDRPERADRPRREHADAPAGGWQQRADRVEPVPGDRPRRDRVAVTEDGWRQRADRPRRDRDAAVSGGWQRSEAPRADRYRRDGRETVAGGWQQRPDRPGRVAQPNRDPRDGRPLWSERNWRGDRDRRDRDWNRGDDRRDWSWNGGGRSWDEGRGRDWNRDWRRDSRYDWGRYRNANRAAYRLPRYYAPYGWNQGYRRFGIGVTLSSLLFAQDYWIADPYAYRLPDAYGPYRWVRYYDDALLVDVDTGQVVDVVNDMFW